MLRIYLLSILLSFQLASFAQEAYPSAIAVPANCKVLIHTYAKGVQVYVYTQDLNDTSKYTWVLKEPIANLYADSAHTSLIGKHYFSAGNTPTWESTDGSKVTGAKLAQVNSPDGAGIPWLLLKAKTITGPGVLQHTAFIQRVHTIGGKPPVVAGKNQKGEIQKVSYTAEYIFYSEK
ncbi:uncharacterized protein DUF3455 [Mucilaginibacter frigoritolerans]|jgi:hypothetical protein|uniref:Uncharacterized protein DUF3455 n=1 Tax=Mucilaginibacter frigoritolerans TaxID=652788 RepID=A0A562TPM6_9SPHI|nr:DUF3455 domain-containing protein [Mucilaginibacter frigoritolerans]TWI94790.1 uncharacterized protein DUF3455 [Mucilaginibacter frigoritolerans]